MKESETLRPKTANDADSRSSSGAEQPLLSVVIPVLNEQEGIAEIVERVFAAESGLKEAGLKGVEVIVVDDGSTDDTAQIVEELPRARLVRHEVNRGYGAAIKTGFRNARGELLAFLDADGTYPPEQFPQLCTAIISQGADVAVGSRRSGAETRMPMVRRLGNLIWSSLVSAIGNRRCIDPASGMRVLRRTALPRLYPLPDGLNFTPVMSTRCMHEDLKLVELPIRYNERKGRSKLSIVGDGTRFLKTILWTSLEYNPVRLLGVVGLTLLGAALAIGAGLIVLRLQGVTVLGFWGVLSVFMALLFGVAGASIYSLGVTFNFLVALFHRAPVSQGLLKGRIFRRSLEAYFGWLGLVTVLLGIGLAAVTVMFGAGQWDITRMWLWLLGSALFSLVGLQLLISWILARVLETLAERENLIGRDMDLDIARPDPGKGALSAFEDGPAHEMT